MANRLKNLKITEVASCHKGINPEAMVVFSKSKEVIEESDVSKSAKGGEINKNQKEVHIMADEVKTYDQPALDAAVSKAIAEKESEIAVLKALSDMADEEKDFYKALPDDKKSEFLKKSSVDRKVEIQKSKSADEELVVKGQTVRKSVVGDSVFYVLKSQQEDIVKANEKKQDTFKKQRRSSLIFLVLLN
jgi:hypothetical protein